MINYMDSNPLPGQMKNHETEAEQYVQQSQRSNSWTQAAGPQCLMVLLTVHLPNNDGLDGVEIDVGRQVEVFPRQLVNLGDAEGGW